MRRFRTALLAPAILASLAVAGCSGLGGETETQDQQIKRDTYKFGSLLGTDGGISLFGGNKRKGDAEAGNGLGVNGFLWRASLDTLAFMPIASADPFGGVILTDWYTPPETPGERVKVNLYILDRQLRADGVRAAVFRQQRVGNDWRDVPVDPGTATTLEDSILTRARQLRIAQAAAE